MLNKNFLQDFHIQILESSLNGKGLLWNNMRKMQKNIHLIWYENIVPLETTKSNSQMSIES